MTDIHIGRVTVHGTGLEARRFADRLSRDLNGALTSALADNAPAARDPVGQVAHQLAARVKAALADQGAIE